MRCLCRAAIVKILDILAILTILLHIGYEQGPVVDMEGHRRRNVSGQGGGGGAPRGRDKSRKFTLHIPISYTSDFGHCICLAALFETF